MGTGITGGCVGGGGGMGRSRIFFSLGSRLSVRVRARLELALGLIHKLLIEFGESGLG